MTSSSSPAPAVGPRSPERFINRELSWLAFNERVLEEAWNPRVPLLERVRFLAISAANLNEFYMVRVAGLHGQVEAGITTPSQDGMTPAEQLAAIAVRSRALMDDQQRCWETLVAELRKHDICVLDESELDAEDRTWIEDHFMSEIFPVLSPIASDPAHPFPFIPNLGFSLVVRCVRAAEDPMFGLVPIPGGIPRFIRLHGEADRFVPVEQVIRAFVDRLFPGFRIEDASVCRVLRDSDVEIEEEAEDLVREFERLLRERRRGAVIRLTLDRDISDDLKGFLTEKIGVDTPDLVATQRLLGLADTSELILDSRPDLLFPPFTPRATERVRDYDGDCFAAIRNKDFIVHHPYEEFDVVVEFLRQAAADPAVVSIKQTLYRTSDDSPIVATLAAAAYAGKSVTALVELKARFDEERNLRWARNLESAGVNVVYGFVRLKTHAKVSLAVRRESGGLRSYAHFGTGNYHPVTARVYTDLSFFTCDRALCRDAAKLFNYMTSTAAPDRFEKLCVSPLNLRRRLEELIDEEIGHARAGRPAGIFAKLNSLVDGGDHRPPVPGVAGRGADRPRGARHLLAASRGTGEVREHPGEEHRGPLPGAQPDRLLRSRARPEPSRGQGVHLVGGLDAPQPRSAGRDPGSHRGPGHPPAGARTDRAGEPHGRGADVAARHGRRLCPYPDRVPQEGFLRPRVLHEPSEPFRGRCSPAGAEAEPRARAG